MECHNAKHRSLLQVRYNVRQIFKLVLNLLERQSRKSFEVFIQSKVCKKN